MEADRERTEGENVSQRQKFKVSDLEFYCPKIQTYLKGHVHMLTGTHNKIPMNGEQHKSVSFIFFLFDTGPLLFFFLSVRTSQVDKANRGFPPLLSLISQSFCFSFCLRGWEIFIELQMLTVSFVLQLRNSEHRTLIISCSQG